MQVRILGAHNCESLNTRLTSLVIDGRLALDAGGLTSGLSIPDQTALRVVLLTHQHYDHTRDILALAMNSYLFKSRIDVYTSRQAYKVLVKHYFNGEIYPDFTKRPEENPAVTFNILEPHRAVMIDEYEVLPVPVNHSVFGMGYQVTDQNGQSVFFTGDTGPGLADCWQEVSPQLLVIECTASNRFGEFGAKNGHITPVLLKEELMAFTKVRGYLPQVVTVHMSPGLEDEIRPELADVATELGITITPGSEGLEISL